MTMYGLGGAAALWLAVAGAAAAECHNDVARLRRPDGSAVSITVEIADDPAERAQGLMDRTSLDPQTGMLFIYETPRPASFWMKNTRIPLDMLFFDAGGLLRHIHPNARPMDLTPIPGATADDRDPDRLMVLELAGGEARRLGLVPGTRLRYPSPDAMKQRCD